MAMTTYTTATAKINKQVISTYGAHTYYKGEKSIYTMNTVGDGISYRYYSSFSNSRSHLITNSQVVDATDNDSVASGINMESFQSVTSEMAKTQV